MATNVHLTLELENFAHRCVDSGRYNNVSEVVRASLRLLQDDEDRRLALSRMLKEAMQEADRDGTVSLDVALAEADRLIATAEK